MNSTIDISISPFTLLKGEHLSEDFVMSECEILLSQIQYISRKNVYIIVLCKNGYGTAYVNFAPQEISSDSVLFLSPIDKFHVDIDDALLECQIIVFSDNFILPSYSTALDYIRDSRQPHLSLSERESSAILDLCKMIRRKINGSNEQFTRIIIQNLLSVVLCDIALACSKSDNQRTAKGVMLSSQFCYQIYLCDLKERGLNYYADKLGVTANHLSYAFRHAMGISAGRYIDESIVRQAKSMLLYTDHSMAEISAALTLPNQSFFGKFFKKHTGYSPLKFRALSK